MVSVKIIECPRDAWQAMPGLIPAASKAQYLRAVIDAGFSHIDAVSFVSPGAVPQMADAEQVLSLLGPVSGVEIIGIVVNQKGAERALGTGRVSTLGFPFSVSPTFLARNQKQTVTDAITTLAAIVALAASARAGVVAYVSMAFGNPYNDPWDADAVVAACRTLHALGVGQICLADTVGVAGPEQIYALVSTVLDALPEVEVGAHLHGRPAHSSARLAAAYRAGCRRFDVALTGQGGCPFAQDSLVGNLATENALAELRTLGASFREPADLTPLLAMARAITDTYGAT